jgi:hypothetical protein
MADALTTRTPLGGFAHSARGRRALARWQQAKPVRAGFDTLDELCLAARQPPHRAMSRDIEDECRAPVA